MGILETIVAERRRVVREMRPKNPLSVLEESAHWNGPRRPFADALRRGIAAPLRFLAEIKCASPSAGVIRPKADIAAIAREYAESGAAALSILTEPKYFGGDPRFLGVARAASGLPLLQKDFIVEEWQILWARSLGADAILLIVAALDRVQLKDLADTARDLGLAALIETHDEGEAERAVEAGAAVIGINHRDLRTLEIDLSISGRILPRIPSHIVRIAESGIRSREDADRMAGLGFDAVLVGEALMRAPSPGAELRRLRGESR